MGSFFRRIGWLYRGLRLNTPNTFIWNKVFANKKQDIIDLKEAYRNARFFHSLIKGKKIGSRCLKFKMVKVVG